MLAVKAFAVDFIYPKRCAGCGRRGGWLCHACDMATERFAPPWCQFCGVPTRFACRCASLPERVAQVRSVGPFDGWLRGAVIESKYHGEWSRLAELGPLLAVAIESLRPFDALVPVPLHPSRFRQRGFNQSLLLARHAANVLGVSVEDGLARMRRTDAQVRLTAEERRRNVQGAITTRPSSQIAGRTLVLIDDVITTGSTLAACAAALSEGGAEMIKAATFSREM